ncbi:MAG: ATP-binding protein [Atopobiaceae bacterium]|nr:ATP-binding protein [Atopobiaceae bacterium]
MIGHGPCPFVSSAYATPPLCVLHFIRGGDERRVMETSGQTYTLDVFVGDQLRPLFEEERLWERRDLVDDLRGFLRGRGPYVCVLYGLRRTGKSTAMLQVLSEMDEDELRRSAFVQLTPGASMRELANDLRRLRSVGVRNVFVDEVTLADDFIDGAAFLSDVMARSGRGRDGTHVGGDCLARDADGPCRHARRVQAGRARARAGA